MKLLLDNLKDKHIFTIGLALVCAGCLLNEWLLAIVFSQDGSLNTLHRIQIWTFDIILLILGSALMLMKTSDFKILRWFGLGLLSLPVLFLLLIFIWRIQFKFSIDYNEGWNAYYSHAAISGQPIYDTQKEWTVVNYPPISFYVVGKMGKIFGDQLLAGRCISIFSLLLISIGTGYLVRRVKGDVYDAIFASIFCLGLFVAYAPHYVGMNDPQLLAHIFIFGGLIIYLQNPARLFLVALFFVPGLLIKHSLIALPAAVTIDLFFRSRKNFYKWIGYFTLLAGGLFLLIQILSEGSFLQELSASRRYSLEKLVYWLLKIGKGLLIPLLVLSPWLLHAIKKDSLKVIPVYLIISLFIGIYFSGGIGTDVNLFFDLFIVISIAAGISISYLRTALQRFSFNPHQSSYFLSIVLIINLSPGFFEQAAIFKTYLQSPQKEKAFLEDADFIKSRTGPALCENILLCYSAGKSLEYDPFIIREKLLLGEKDEREIINLLEKGYFKIVQLNQKLPDRYFDYLNYTTIKEHDYFTENFIRAIGRYYILVRETNNGTFFYEPNR